MNKGLPLSTGVLWLGQSWRIITKAPLPVFGIVSSYLVLICLLSLPGLIPGLSLVGMVLSSIVTPFGAMAIVSCGRDVSQGKLPLFSSCWKEGWKNRQVRGRLICLGLVYGICILIVGFIFDLLCASYTAKWMNDAGQIDPQAVAQNIPWAGLIFGCIGYSAILCITCFSPMLIAWKGQTLGKAFFFSLFICLKNIGALLVLAFVLFLVASVGSLGLTAVAGSQLGSFFIILWGLFITCWSYSCLWPMWISIFGPNDCTVP